MKKTRRLLTRVSRLQCPNNTWATSPRLYPRLSKSSNNWWKLLTMTLDECLNIKCKNPSWLQSIRLPCCRNCVTLYRKHQMDYCRYWRKRTVESDDYEPRAEWMLFVSVHIQTMFLFSYTLHYLSVLKHFCHFQFCGRPGQRTANSSKLWASRWDLMTPGERWRFVRRCLQPGQLWTPWGSLDESILHFYSQEKGEDNCSVLTAASNCFERWRTIMKPGVTNHLGDGKSLEKDSEHFFFFPVVYPLVTHNWLHYMLC